MTAPSRPNVALLPKGHELPPASFTLTPEALRAYLDAVRDASNAYDRFAPPLAAVALALRALLERLYLPEGSLHTAQEFDCRAPIPAAAELTMTSRIVQRSERGGFVATAIEFELTAHGAAEPAILGRTTVMAPKPEEAP